MLSDEQVERYSRQILLAEVGGRGQERLLAARVVVHGDGPTAGFAASLLAAAGVGVACDREMVGPFAIDAGAGTVVARTGDARTMVATLVGRPCVQCLPETVWGGSTDEWHDANVADQQVVAALVAAETLRVILGLAEGGRVRVVDVARGVFTNRPVPATSGCAACGVPS
jgi:hypothetical protein